MNLKEKLRNLILRKLNAVHGRWEQSYKDGFARLRCTACGGTALMVEDTIFKTNINWKYCPNCGKPMDVERRTDGR